MTVEYLVSPASLPGSGAAGIPSLSLLSYNVLLPNSKDGWWIYKMYNPHLLQETQGKIATWERRQRLLRERIQEINADVVCLQETAPETFESDFGFMADLGYDGVALYKKGRFRPATFWRTSKCTLASPAVHKDRSLITAFTLNEESNISKHWFVVNVHLQAGKQGPRRVRQMHEAIRGALTLAKKLKEPEPQKNIQLLVCGDMNGGDECGAVRMLEHGYVDQNFHEDNEPVTSGRKELPLAFPMTDATSVVQRPGGEGSPPTMVVAELMSSLMTESTYNSPELSQPMEERLGRIYKSLATGENGTMNSQDVQKYLVKINLEVGRGDAFRNAAKAMGWVDDNPDTPEEEKQVICLPENGILTLDAFKSIYQKELDGGKYWAIAHDMAVLGDPLPEAGTFAARYDRMYFSAALTPTAVLDTVASDPCPNDREPSDHLPVAALFHTKPTPRVET